MAAFTFGSYIPATCSTLFFKIFNGQNIKMSRTSRGNTVLGERDK